MLVKASECRLRTLRKWIEPREFMDREGILKRRNILKCEAHWDQARRGARVELPVIISLSDKTSRVHVSELKILPVVIE